MAELHDTPWLVNGQGTRCTAAATRLLDAAGVQPSISASVADNDTLLGLVAAGHGVTIVPESLLAAPRDGVHVASEDLGETRTLFAVHRKVAVKSMAPLVALLAEQSLVE